MSAYPTMNGYSYPTANPYANPYVGGYDPYAAYGQQAYGQQANPYASLAPQQQTAAYGMPPQPMMPMAQPQVAPSFSMPQAMPNSPLAPQPSNDMFVPAPVPAELATPQPLAPASTALQPDATKGPDAGLSGQPKQKSMLPRLAALGAAGLGIWWAYNQFFGKPKDPTADAITPDSPFADSAKNFLQGLNKDAVTGQTKSEFLSKLKEHNKTLSEEERVQDDKLEENAIRTLKTIVEGEDEPMKESAQKLLDVMDANGNKLPQVAEEAKVAEDEPKAETKSEASTGDDKKTEDKKAS